MPENLPEHITHKASGGYACMHCGGEVGEDGQSVYESPEEEAEGEQEEHAEELSSAAMTDFVKAVRR